MEHSFGPFNINQENRKTTKATFTSSGQLDIASKCDSNLKVKTDLNLRIQRDDSTHATKVVYYRLDTKKQETFEFDVGFSDNTRLEFDGTNLVCRASSKTPQCNKLPIARPVKVLLISVDINPRKGKAKRNEWTRNQYNLKGSYTRVECEKSELNNFCVIYYLPNILDLFDFRQASKLIWTLFSFLHVALR